MKRLITILMESSGGGGPPPGKWTIDNGQLKMN